MYAALYYLISWPEEGDSLSVVPGHKIVSPPAEELIGGCMCKVKGFEKNPAKVITLGTYTEMNNKLEEVEGTFTCDETGPPPKKKARLGSKENKTTQKQNGKKSQKKNEGWYCVML